MLVAVATNFPARATDLPDDEELENSGAVVGEIVIQSANVFDPQEEGEDRKVFRFVNRLHRRTRDRVTRGLLLFEPGDPYLRRTLDESARTLREANYFYDANVRPIRYEDGRVDVLVETRDVWSLRPGIGFGRAGGENSFHFGLTDENMLGLGKSLTFKHKSNVDRTESLVRYRDPNLAGRRMVLELEHSNNSDGRLRALKLVRPFFSLDSRWATGFRARSDDRIDSLYSLGEVTNRFTHEEDFVELFGGFSRGLAQGRARRWTVGATLERDRFGAEPGFAGPQFAPPNRDLVYPWIGLEVVHDRFFVVRDLDHIARIEDRNLGRHYSVRLGLAAPAFGADRSRAILRVEHGFGLSPGEGQWIFFNSHASGRFGSSKSENVLVGGDLRYYARNWGEHVLFAAMRFDLAIDLDPENQLLLGGDSGLRGYPLRYQAGTRRYLLTLEQRWYTRWHPFKLFRVGAAAFVDVGRAWFPESGRNQFDELRNVGVGLRLGSSRTSTGSLVHVDLAMPLDGDDSISRVQLFISSRESF